MHIIDRLHADALKKGPVCVGLDTQVGFLPECIAKKDMNIADKVFEFNKRIVDATCEDAACYKIQIACYEALGLKGMEAYARTVKYAREKGCVVIGDVKRGDIASTAKQYAQGHFTGDFEVDIMTINSYMGEDAVSPYYPYLEQGKGLFLLVKTSNPSSGDLQDRDCEGMTVFERMAEYLDKWGKPFIGESGFSAIGAVTGCTYPEQFHLIHEKMPNGFFLIPGYGAQGGTGKDIAAFFKDGICGVVNSSRGIICAHKNKSENDDFDLYIHDAVIAMRKDILSWL